MITANLYIRYKPSYIHLLSGRLAKFCSFLLKSNIVKNSCQLLVEIDGFLTQKKAAQFGQLYHTLVF